MYEIKLEKFQGPLSLLLQLIEQEELAITEVSLAQVTDQFLQYLKKIEKLNPEEVVDFLVVASRLLLIKSRLLLPSLEVGGEAEAQELEQQLKLYREYLSASRQFDSLWSNSQVSYVRLKPLITERPIKFNPPPLLKVEDLEQALQSLLKTINPWLRLPEIAIRQAVSIQEKINHLRRLITRHLSLNWQTIVDQTKDKTEIIVFFLALLELVKQRQLAVEQHDLFADIKISKAQS
ncbi:MAG: segregation/condensation protein A [Patescibacteria group bacterium]